MNNPIIDKTLERLPGNWYQGDYSDAKAENFCLYGHYVEAFNDLGLGVSEAHYAAGWNALTDQVRRLGANCPIAYNDLPSTSEEDIILLLKRANEGHS